VQVVYGKSLAGDDLSDVATQTLTPAGTDEPAGPPATGAPTLFTGTVELDRAGAFGYTVRVVPRNDLLISPAEMGLIAVAS
jgi:starch phosphorylase